MQIPMRIPSLIGTALMSDASYGCYLATGITHGITHGRNVIDFTHGREVIDFTIVPTELSALAKSKTKTTVGPHEEFAVAATGALQRFWCIAPRSTSLPLDAN